MDAGRVDAIRQDMERMEAHRLQPHFIEAFFMAAFESLGGKLKPREADRWEITSVPFAVRSRDMQIGFGEPVVPRYERVCFDKTRCNVQGKPVADLLVPGHPLLNATLDLVLERGTGLLKQGSIFIDREDMGTQPRLLCYIEDAVQDGTVQQGGQKRVISKNLHFVEISPEGQARNAGYAPYLDYSAPNESELPFVRAYLDSQVWLAQGAEALAMDHAIRHIVPRHVAQVRERKYRLIDKTIKAVKERLTSEIQFWDYRSAELAQKEAAGQQNTRLSAQMAARRAEELAGRLQKRMAELEAERQISALPPVIAGGAVVLPMGLVLQLRGEGNTFAADADARRRVELAAMEAVMAHERSLGYEPLDVSAQNVGYDVESIIPRHLRTGDQSLRLIEVKGRAAGATTVTLTKNEILTALNKPESYILALVEVDGDSTAIRYLRQPFRERPDFAATSVNYDIGKLFQDIVHP